ESRLRETGIYSTGNYWMSLLTRWWFRSAQIFFRGEKEATKTLPIGDAQTIWKALSGDLGSLTSFFDQIILAYRLPIIDYGITFDSAEVTFDSVFDPSRPWISQFVNRELEEDAVLTVH